MPVPVPMCVGKASDHRDDHGKSGLLVHFEDVEEIVVLEEAHGSVCDLKVTSGNALDDPFKDLRHEHAQLIGLAHLQDLLQLC